MILKLTRCWAPFEPFLPGDQGTKRLEKSAYITKTSPGCYALLPLGRLLYSKVSSILHAEAERRGYLRIHASCLQRYALWERSGRARSLGKSLAQLDLARGTFVLNASQEEQLAEIFHRQARTPAKPMRLYQLSERVRNEVRPAHGLIRSVSFHLADFYVLAGQLDGASEEAENLKSLLRGTLSSFGVPVMQARHTTAEAISFYVASPDTTKQCMVNECSECSLAFRGLSSKSCPDCAGPTSHIRAVELADFVVHEKMASELKPSPLLISAGIGVSRLLAVLAAVWSDERGFLWPRILAPYDLHLAACTDRREEAEAFASKVSDMGKVVVLDDRDVSFSRKLIDSSLLGGWATIVMGKRYPDACELKVDREDKWHQITAEAALVKLSSD